MTAQDDAKDALYVLSATLLTPARYPGVLGDDYAAACAALGLVDHPDGYGLIFGQDAAGARWTAACADVARVAVALSAWDAGLEPDLSPQDSDVVASLPGWPLPLAIATPGLPEPHDPEPDAAAGPVLRPPDAGVWGPAQRRLGADEIAQQWAEWRAQLDDDGSGEGDGGPGGDASAAAGGGPDGADAPGAAAGGERAGAFPDAVRRVLDDLRGYVADPPPPGRIRSAFASGEARTLRADGPGWSLVARTDDIALVLLDEAPGEVFPVGRGPELPGLLEALDALAAKPA